MTAGVSLAMGAHVDLEALLGRPELVDAEVVAVSSRRTTVRARRRQGGSFVAVKLAPPLVSRRAQRRFLAEVGVLLRLAPSPHIVPVLQAGVGAGGTPWLVSPWVAGGSLGDRLDHTGPLAVDVVVETAVGAASGLAVLHQQDVVHGNVTPRNLLWEDRTLLDGMALPSLAPAPHTAGPAPHHVPPEVLEGAPWTALSDVWALGSCLYTLLAGQPPWARGVSDGVTTLVLAMATSGPPPLHRTDVPPWLVELVGACLAVEPTGRPGSPEAVEAWVRRARPDTALTLAPSSLDVEGRPLGSRYLLLEPIGAGASGQVWRARRRWDGAAVAVKVLRPELSSDPNAVARFLRERNTLIGLDHPNLVDVLDLVAEGGVLAIVMQLVEGSDLRALLRANGAMAAPAAAVLLAQVAAALAAIHREGVVHRDLKPENVLVETGGDPVPTVRVTDFGVARSVGGTTVTAADQLVGTADYLAPELVAGRPLTPAADIYSLGVVAYELLSGHRPFEGEHPAAVLRAHLDAAPAPLASPLWGLVAACLAKDPAARPDAAAVASSMSAFASGASMSETPARALEPAAVEPPAVPVIQTPPPAASTATFASPLGRSPAKTAGGLTRGRRHRPWWLVAVSVLVLAAAAAGVAVALTGSSSQPPAEATADVTSTVTATGDGAVTVTWSDVSGKPGFQTYLLLQDGQAASTQPSGTATHITMDGVPPGNHCFRVAAAFQGPLPSGLPHPNTSKQCVAVP